MSTIRACVLTGLLLALAAAEPAAAQVQPGSSHQERFGFCMSRGEFNCMRRVVEGDIPYAAFQDLSGRRTRVRVCVKDREGRRCWPRKRAAKAYDIIEVPILYRTTGKHLTTWRVKGKVVGRWRWRVRPEPE
jgi:hypothetical protein